MKYILYIAAVALTLDVYLPQGQHDGFRMVGGRYPPSYNFIIEEGLQGSLMKQGFYVGRDNLIHRLDKGRGIEGSVKPTPSSSSFPVSNNSKSLNQGNETVTDWIKGDSDAVSLE